ncbi:hypothetical protein J5U23_00212 [Saccharolobus shibatae B12]|uniref:Uncharacterized protein n=2 Tax=Saccharolobus shibatae TaxID=2286 RepID=A0A8F5BSH1_9CREN|nr:hypothetical protein J5U23_00212 [Saccharolobus shibatae B12]QXJ30652.1 hypothetical protein J5U21_00301 [Saccharolobus shibatae]QXJ33680.1 hypothetical protein J5U22_00225 [Saccharolobus shibatae]
MGDSYHNWNSYIEISAYKMLQGIVNYAIRKRQILFTLNPHR